MAKQHPRKSEFRLSFLQLVVISGFCLGCMAVSYWLGVYTGTRAGYETAIDSDLAASAKIPINPPAVREERPASVSDVYAKLDGTSSMGMGSTPGPKNTGAAELAAIQKVEVPQAKSQLREAEDLDAELADTLVNQEDQAPAPKSAHTPKSASEEVWSASAGQPAGVSKGGAADTLAAVKIDEGGKAAPEQEPKQATGKKLHEESKKQEGAGGDIQAIPPAATKAKEPEKSALQQIAQQSPTASPKELKEEKAKEKEKIKDEKIKDKEKALKEKALQEEEAAIPQKEKAVPKGWFAQVAAPRELKDADAIASKLRKSGFPVVVETARVRGENYYRILVGPESSQETANRLLGQLKRESYLQGEPFVKMVK